ncbi:hypothetical protein LQ327_01345 [Actinomycetospora endophytica]|uniref:Uncharacterized protein n=1 Tax=Actinomycetospora endophytica TaxID=2291215 RepID=A0ABS8P392_9PSEU|nr:hypothetical protein [Actinomycetospora endophytica]MCD2192035.1 hypothetical protein [Actinomycetospora endophytica]
MTDDDPATADEITALLAQRCSPGSTSRAADSRTRLFGTTTHSSQTEEHR